MRQLLDLLRDIRDNGYRKSNRTGVDTIAVVGRQVRFDLRKGFPLETTRPIYVRALINELLFFIKGLTDNTWLNERDVHIWDQWAVKEDHGHIRKHTGYDMVQLFAAKLGITNKEAQAQLEEAERAYIVEARARGDEVDPRTSTKGGERLLVEHGIPLESRQIKVKKGELGPIYGAQWRRWKTSRGGEIDQLGDAIQTLRTNPFSRRIIVSAWNPEVLPDEKKSPEQNALEGKQCLAACHTFFQLTVTPPQNLSEGKGVLHLHLYQRKHNCAFAM